MPEDMDIYMKKIKQRADATDNVMDKLKADRMADLDKLRIDAEMEEVKAKLEESRAKVRESQQAGQALAPQQAYNLAELLFAGRPPEEIKQIINSLTEEEIHKLAYMASAMNNNKLSEFREYMRQPSTSMKEVVDAIKIGTEIAKPQQQPQGSISDIAKSMAEMFKTGVEVGRGQTQPQQPQPNSFEMMKQYHDMFLKPVLDKLDSKEQKMLKMRMNQIKNKITAQVSPQDYIKTIKQTSQELGLSSAGKGEIDIKIEEMRQAHDVDMAKLGFETRKWEHQKDSEGRTIEQVKDLVKTVTEGPVGKALEALGEAGADKIRGSPKKNSSNIIQVTCPNCQGKFQGNDQLAKIYCPLCGAELQKATAPTPQPPPAAQPTQLEQKPEEPQATQSLVAEGQAQVDGQPTK